MKLHEAIEFVIYKKGRSASAREIADEINAGRLYQRSDGNLVSASQIHARIKNYPDLFRFEKDGRIYRIENTLKDLLSIAKRMQNAIFPNAPLFNISFSKKHLLLPALFFFKRMVDNPTLMKRHLDLGNKGFKFGHDGYTKFLKELNSSSNPFKGKLTNLIDDAGSLSQLIIKDSLLEDLADSNLSEKNISTTEFGVFFNELIYTTGKQNLKTGEFYSPKVLGVLLHGLVPERISQSTSIYNPATGFATIPAILSQKSGNNFTFFGEEINRDVFLLATMNLMVNNINTDHFQNADTFLAKNFDTGFDYALCVPPFIGKYSGEEIQKTFPVKTTDLDLLFIQKCVFGLKKNGKAFILIPDSVLYSTHHESFSLRQYLYNNNYIEGVISLPADLLFPFSGVKTSLLVLSNKQNMTVTFVDAENGHLSAKSDKQVNDKIVAEICEKYNSPTVNLFECVISEPERVYGRILKLEKTYKSISGKELSLSVKRNMVFDDPINDGKKPLSVVLVRYEGPSPKVDGKLPFVNIGDLNDDPFLVYLDETRLTHTTDFQKGRIIHEPALLISSISPKAKPTFYKPQNRPILISRNIHILKVNSNKIELEYLISQLSTEEFRNQMEAFAVGSTSLKRISINDLLNLRIKLPALEQQKEIIRIQKEGIYSRKIKEAREFAKKSGITAKSEKELLGFLKHEIGNIAGGVTNDITTLKNFIARKRVDFSEAASGSQRGASLTNVFARIQGNMQDIENLMTNIERVINLADSEIEKTPIVFSHFVTSECDKVGLFKEAGIKLFLRCSDYSLPLFDEKVLFDEKQFGVVVRNFVINSIKHGFQDEASEKIIVFNLEEDEDYYYIHMINNGEPFPEEFTLEDFLMFGGRQSNEKGSGIGGFLIGKVIDNHGGTIELIPSGKTIYIEDNLVSLEIKPTITLRAGVHFLIKLPKE